MTEIRLLVVYLMFKHQICKFAFLMGTILHKASDRGKANHGWLQSFHSFSFAGFLAPDKMRFGLLRVLNDDVVAPGMGFGKHPHDNMEIISIPLKGSLAHRDSTGRAEIIKTNDVQIMSAGSGIEHSEMNASVQEPVNFLQIWIYPKQRNISPRYEQKTFDPIQRINNWQIVVSPGDSKDAVWINQDSWLALSKPQKGFTLEYKTHLQTNGIYLFVIEGEVIVNGQDLGRRDALGLDNMDTLTVTAKENSELLLIEVPMN
jgi:redox-sensitive bicupin YhaK (pirin superfamily)